MTVTLERPAADVDDIDLRLGSETDLATPLLNINPTAPPTYTQSCTCQTCTMGQCTPFGTLASLWCG
jgi:hypothetical protein